MRKEMEQWVMPEGVFGSSVWGRHGGYPFAVSCMVRMYGVSLYVGMKSGLASGMDSRIKMTGTSVMPLLLASASITA